ncbi:MAG: hypothetical protein ACRC51_08905 [Cetobacterium sp.]
MTNIIKKNNWQEIINTDDVEIVEENFFVDESSLKNKELIRVDINIIQFPIFSKNTRRKVNQIVKYYFNRNHDTFITVTPKAGDYIPGETEEKIFIALMQIMKERGLPRKFIVSATDLKNKVKFSTTKYNKLVENSLSRLASTSYIFKNTLYSNEKGGILSEKIETSIFNIKTLSLSEEKNGKYRNIYPDKRVKIAYEIEFSEHFYKNIIKKGYMVYNGEKLLEIETSTARTIYMLIEKLRFNNLYLKLDTLFLIRRIPLKYSSKNMNQTIGTLEKSFKELVERKLIKNFKFIKETTWENSEVEINFNDEVNSKKLERFYRDLNDFKKISTLLTISDTELDLLKIEKNKNEEVCVELSSVRKETVEVLFNLLPNSAKKLKSMPKTISDALEKYSEQEVKNTILYMKQQKTIKSPRMYFLKALEGKWSYDSTDIIKVEKNNITEVLKPSETTFDYTKDEFLDLEVKFNKLSLVEKEKLEEIVYKDYLEKCGAKTKVQDIAFRAGKRTIILKFLKDSNYFAENIKNNEIDEKILKNEVGTEELIDKAKQYLQGMLIMLAGDILAEDLLKIKIEITRDIFLEKIKSMDEVQMKIEELLLIKK